MILNRLEIIYLLIQRIGAKYYSSRSYSTCLGFWIRDSPLMIQYGIVASLLIWNYLAYFFMRKNRLLEFGTISIRLLIWEKIIELRQNLMIWWMKKSKNKVHKFIIYCFPCIICRKTWKMRRISIYREVKASSYKFISYIKNSIGLIIIFLLLLTAFHFKLNTNGYFKGNTDPEVVIWEIIM